MAGGNLSKIISCSGKATLLAFCSTLTLSVATGSAMAQIGASEADDDVIIVSARRRDESLQDVPVAVSAYNADQLSDLGASDLTDLEAVTPNVTLETSRATNSTLTAFIRGVGQQDPVAGFEAGVGIYIDDVYLNRPQAALLDIYEVERIEVLRGPQGTLYGRNTIGGAVKYVTRRLSEDPRANVRFTAGTYDQLEGVGSFSVPVAIDSAVGDLMVGGALAYFSRGGYGENLNIPGLENYNKDLLAARLAVEWNPMDTLSFRISGDWSEDNSDPKQGHRLLPVTIGANVYPVLDNVFDTRAGLNTPTQKITAKGVTGVVEWQASENFTLKNILAYREDRSDGPIDFDSLPEVDLDVPGLYDNSQFSEEFQIIYESDRLNGLVGFYYLDADALTQFDVVLDLTADLLMLDGVNAYTSTDVGTKTWSIFGDFTFDLTDTLAISVGGRYTDDDRSISLDRSRYFTAGFSPTFGGPDRAPTLIDADLDATANFTDFSPRASITWQPSDEHTLYFSYSQGFKGGSFDPRCGAAAAPDLDGDGMPGATDYEDQVAFCGFDPENITTYEGGWKNNLFGGRLRSSLAVFYSDYTDVQVPGSVGIDADMDGIAETFAGVTTNAAAATLYGFELEGNALVGEDMFHSGDALNYQFSLGYIHAEFDEYLGRTGTDISDVARFQNTPEVTAFSQLAYTKPMSMLGEDGEARIYTSASYRGLTHQFGYASAALDQPGFFLMNAGVSWTSSDGGLKVSVHGTNLLNKEYIVAGYDFVTTLPEFGNSALGLSGVLTSFYGDPRRVFGSIELAF